MKNVDKKRLKEIMHFVLKQYPKGCAQYNWNNYYKHILSDEEEIQDYEINEIIQEAINEFKYEDLGLCGCGLPEDTLKVIKLILKAFKDNKYLETDLCYSICNINEETANTENYMGLIQFVLYVLNDKKFLQHNAYIFSSTLTDKGNIFLELLEMNEIDEDKILTSIPPTPAKRPYFSIRQVIVPDPMKVIIDPSTNVESLVDGFYSHMVLEHSKNIIQRLMKKGKKYEEASMIWRDATKVKDDTVRDVLIELLKEEKIKPGKKRYTFLEKGDI